MHQHQTTRQKTKMLRNELKKRIFVTSFIVTVIIFVLGLMTSYVLDSFRLDEITNVIESHEIDKSAYLLEQEYVDSLGEDSCIVMRDRFYDLKMEMGDVGQALTKYSGRSMLKTVDFDYMKRHYFLLELEFLTMLNKLNMNCDTDYITLLFFYDKDDQDSITQGYVLEDISKSHKTNVVVLSFDREYKDEPLVQMMVEKYNVTSVPTMIINNDIKIEGLQYGAQVNTSLRQTLRYLDADKEGKNKDFNYVLKAAGINKTWFIKTLENQSKEENISYFGKADMLLVLGRLKQDPSIICSSLEYYDKAVSDNALSLDDHELNAVIYETVVAVGCGRNREAFLKLAAEEWKKAGNDFRSSIMKDLSEYKSIEFVSETSLPKENFIKNNATSFILGSSGFIIEDDDIIVSQVDRVNRDWFGLQLNQSPNSEELLSVFSERFTYDEKELLENIGWHEGARIEELIKSGAAHKTATATLVARIDDKWYAPNEKGVFMFEVPIDKLLYPTTRFLTDDIAVIIDTHGINMIVEQAIRKKATVVIGCCDHPAKIKAALYLSDRGINVICPPDKYAYFALGKGSNIYPSPPISSDMDKVFVGAQPITFRTDESFVVMNATLGKYALWYYQTPTSYFESLSQIVDIDDITYISIDDFNQMQKIINIAESIGANVVAVRVFNSDDYKKLKQWLDKSPFHRAILFHSLPYPYGYKILNEFPEQVTFGDVNPRFI